MSDDSPRPDQIEGAAHPRDAARLIGQDAAEAAFLQAFVSDRLHHAWLLTGPRGVGKATLAWRIARFLLATPPQQDDGLFGAPPPPETLDISADHPVTLRMAAGAEPGLRHITRSLNDNTGKLRADIVVDDIRKMADFFHLSAPDGGRRVVIVDAADDMNTSAANALLKMLEEPPADTILLLISHQPSRLLPTIRSRCRSLRLVPLPAEAIAQILAQTDHPADAGGAALSELSGGSVGEALRLLNLSGLEIYTEIIGLLGTMPRLDRTRAHRLADAAAARGAETKLDLLIHLIDLALARLARHGASGIAAPEAAPDEAALFARLAPTAHAARKWAETSAEATARLRHGRAVNLDPAALLLDTLITLNDTAARLNHPSPA